MKGDHVCLTEQERISSAKFNSMKEKSRVYWEDGVAMVCSAKERSDLTFVSTSLNPCHLICQRSGAGCMGCDASQCDERAAASGWSQGQGGEAAAQAAVLRTLCPARRHPLPGDDHRDPSRSPGKGTKPAEKPLWYHLVLLWMRMRELSAKVEINYQPIPT